MSGSARVADGNIRTKLVLTPVRLRPVTHLHGSVLGEAILSSAALVEYQSWVVELGLRCCATTNLDIMSPMRSTTDVSGTGCYGD